MNNPDALLRDAVFGAADLPPGVVRDRIKREGLRFPLAVAALAGDHPALAGLDAVWLLRLHPGLTYATAAASPGRLASVLGRMDAEVGPALPVEGAAAWLPRLRESIVRLRERELAGLAAGAAEPDAADRDRLGTLARVQLLDGDPAWPETLAAWTRAVLAADRHKLASVQRRVVEWLSRLTAGVDPGHPLSVGFVAAVQRVCSTYDFAAFPGLLVELGETLRPHLARHRSVAGRLSPPVAAAVRRIETGFAQPLTLVAAARAAHVTPAYLSRRLRSETGRTFTELLRAVRIDHARELLLRDDAPLRAVAADAGFGSVEHFQRTFKAAVGVPPGAFRSGRLGPVASRDALRRDR